MEAFLKLVKLSFFLVKILNQSSSSLLHFVQSAFQPLDDPCHWSLHLSSVLRVPNVVSDELLDGLLPLFLEKLLVAHHLELVHQAINVLDKNIVSCDENFLLLSLRLSSTTLLSRKVGFVQGLSLGSSAAIALGQLVGVLC